MECNPFKHTTDPVGAWLASDEARKTCSEFADAFAGKPGSYRIACCQAA